MPSFGAGRLHLGTRAIRVNGGDALSFDHNNRVVDNLAPVEEVTTRKDQIGFYFSHSIFRFKASAL